MNIIYPKVTSKEMRAIVEKVELAKPKDYSGHKKNFCVVTTFLLNLIFLSLIIFTALLQGPLKVPFIFLSIFLGLVNLMSNGSILANGFKKNPSSTIIEIIYDKIYPQKKEAEVVYKKSLFNIQKCSNIVNILTYLQEQQCEVKQLSPDTLMIKHKDGVDTIHISSDVCRYEGETLDFTVIDDSIAKIQRQEIRQ